MLILEASNLKKYYNDRLIFTLNELKVYDYDRIGIVGINGAGKTTLLNILSELMNPDEGFIKLYGSYSYITQLNDSSPLSNDKAFLSGGEKTSLKVSESLDKNSCLLFADEPTSNLDINNIKHLEERLKHYKGAILIISHDRELLDGLCTSILEIENGTVTLFSGNYSSYKEQKKMLFERKKFEYEEYMKEKLRLKAACEEISRKSSSMKKAPSRMGNSEARLHKGSTRQRQGKLSSRISIIEGRLNKLEEKQKPQQSGKVLIDIPIEKRLHSRIVMSVENLSKTFGKRVLFKNLNFQIVNGSKTALIGDNGTGKTTLIKMLLNQEAGTKLSKVVKPGYFSQDLDILNNNKSLLENVMKKSIYDETTVRTLLARLLFKRNDVYKRVEMLSGGERVKATFAVIFTQDINMLVLDEPTNYLDIDSQEALTEVLKDFSGTLLFVSHDRWFINQLADHLIILDDQSCTCFTGNYEQFIKNKNKKLPAANNHNEIFVLENKLSEILGRLSSPTKKDNVALLDEEYNHIVKRLKELKS